MPKCKPPLATRKTADINYFTPEQAKTFLEILESDEYKVSFQLQVFYNIYLFSGCRRGECLALKWYDIDFKKAVIIIAKSTKQAKGGQITGDTKTGDRRIIKLPPSVMDLIRKLKIEQAKYRLSVGDYWQISDWLFIQTDGRQMHCSTPTTSFTKLIVRYNEGVTEENKLPEISLHGLRNTAATLLISS